MLPAQNLWSLGMVLYILVIRLMPYLLELVGYSIHPATTVYPWNFSPVMAICLLSPVAFSTSRVRSLLVPLGGMLLSDLVILALKGPEFALYRNQPVVYACFVLGVLIGGWLQQRRSFLRLVGCGLFAELLFFAVTNLGVWWFQIGSPMAVYSADLSGLVTCYVAALPFFGRSLLSTAIYGSALYLVIQRVEASCSVKATASI